MNIGIRGIGKFVGVFEVLSIVKSNSENIDGLIDRSIGEYFGDFDGENIGCIYYWGESVVDLFYNEGF